ncbi:tRNA pseudouridine(55) synthase TruB [Mycoplasmopsis gallopavonis]|uniref:tRNA pseudouridine(55) synthase n=1 Tax=Mycoplasmopsis gallopavonis TaxID=76629 RepID=A0A449B0E3_9BACT|nr:tRNA pseudouridine(55) synthase TruB [Mycoplasmopsis gallopavonis]RIV16459.1 tRNA pseudouridine(55) synthase TruB [Mycoplasmopsis gallopavonis]VEU73198.1 tRNA pseudouridine synthase B [Mycoplasmopsis gallopavonis]
MFYKFHKASKEFANQTIRKFGKKINATKVGHTGILDPLASGLMIVATDSDTKLLEYISDKTKAYIAKAKFGYKSESLDIDTPVSFLEKTEITKKNIEEVLPKILKLKEQIPPIYSAKKINGKKAYEYARENQKVEMRVQKIEIFELQILNFDFKKQELEIYMKVSEGTYVRSLLMDLAKFLKTSCVMNYLKRVECGTIKLNKLEENQSEQLDWNELIDLPFFELNEFEINQLHFGRSFQKNNFKDNQLVLGIKEKKVACVGIIQNNKFQPKKVFLERLS